ncbi:MAG: thiamine phosphate synthase [Betaproteobacteria bacterium]|nr:thiamine phosphate synthase [Betaproteobacteria bacterium]MBM3384364.1 thiamine phosphate synthase [Betaproteobacteria bacterium]
MTIRGLYAITPDGADSARLLQLAARALEGGTRLLQYRNKSAPPAQRLAEARTLVALASRHGARLIVNDDLALALQVKAHGLHLGREDGELAAARAAFPGLLGASCYDSLDLARRAAAAGADYIAFGSMFPSPTKPGAARAPLTLFAEARPLGLPTVAIGGITLANAPQLVAAGADGLAVISALFDAPEVAAAARAFNQLYAQEAAVR